MNSNLKIGITGGLGLIGKALRKKMSRSVVFISRQQPDSPLKANEKCLVGSFTDPEIREKFIQNIDVLIHTATAVGPRSEFDPLFIENDLVGTIDLAKAFFNKNPNGHFIFLSTAGGLYNLNDSGIKTEESELFPDNLYGAIKLIIENFLESQIKEKGVVTILRPVPIYGDSFKKNQTTGLIDKLLKSTLPSSENLPVSIFDRLESARDYLHVDDLINAIDMIVDRQTESRFDVYNLGTGKETSIQDVLNLVDEISDEKARVEIIPVSKEPSSLAVNCDKIFHDIGWKSKISLHEGISKMYQDLKKNNQET